MEGGFVVRAEGDQARIPEKIAEVISGGANSQELDARLVQPYYSKRLAASAGLHVVDGARRWCGGGAGSLS